MSCSQPNNQQFNDETRALILPREGYSFVVHDYSQIEYRFIVHYIRNEEIIAAYQENPELDFHQMMADQVGIDRDPAKTLNLAMGYGMGKKKTIASLKTNKKIIAATNGDENRAREIAEDAYSTFHVRLPELKDHTYTAEIAARERGYVRNDYGRRCHLPIQFAYTAFNRVCQSHAADLIKERANALDDVRHEYGAHLLALVHDEILSEVPTEAAEAYAARATEVLCQSTISVRVPIRCTCGISDKNWLEAKH